MDEPDAFSPALTAAIESLSSIDLHDFILTVLSAYHEREYVRLASILEATRYATAWAEQWPAFSKSNRNPRQAVRLYTHAIQSWLDGGPA